MNAQAIQNKIYQKMSAKKKLEVMVSFYRTGKFLNNLKNAKHSRNRKSDQNRQNS